MDDGGDVSGGVPAQPLTKSEVRGQKSEVRSQKWKAIGFRLPISSFFCGDKGQVRAWVAGRGASPESRLISRGKDELRIIATAVQPNASMEPRLISRGTLGRPESDRPRKASTTSESYGITSKPPATTNNPSLANCAISRES
jgi:hypothetical protein